MYYKPPFFLLIFIILLSSGNSVAQGKLFLCSEYETDGTSKGIFENWTIQKGGNYMYLMYTSETLLKDTVFVSIEKTFNRKDSNLHYFDHYYLVPDISKKWAVNKYTFSKTGNYKISVYDRNSNLLATHTTTVTLAQNAYEDMHFVDTWYYQTSGMEFYEKAVGDSMIGKKDVFALQSDETKVILYVGLQYKQPFKTDHFAVRIYTDDKCRELIKTSTYYVGANWYWTFVPVYFSQKGKFIVELYNDDDVYINSRKIEIN